MRSLLVVSGFLLALAVPPASAAPGDEAWSARFDLEGLDDVGLAIVASSDGSRVYVGGSVTSSTSGLDFLTVAYDAATGQRVWTKRFTGPGNHRDEILALAIRPDDGLLFVTGPSEDAAGEPHYRTIAYEAGSGHVRWTRTLDGHVGNPEGIAVSPDGRVVFVTGGSARGLGPTRIVTVAYRAATGSQDWVARDQGATTRPETGVSIAAGAGSRRVFVTGIADGGPAQNDFVTMAYRAADGSTVWTRRYDGPASGKDRPRQLTLSPDGSMVFVTGTTMAETHDYATVAYRAGSGRHLWSRRFDGNGAIDNSFGVASNGDTVFVTGRSGRAPTDQDAVTIAYEARTGLRRWLDRYDGPDAAADGAVAVAPSPDGSEIFVAGSDTAGASSEFATLAYTADSGQRVWDAHYQGPGGGIDAISGLAVDPLGARVFVTGQSDGGATEFDLATIAYAA